MPNPYALGRSGGYNYSSPQVDPASVGGEISVLTFPEQENVAFAEPDAQNVSDNGYLDNPAGAGVGRATSGHESIYALPVGNPDFAVHQTDGTGTREDISWSAGQDFPAASRAQLIPRYDRRPDEGSPVTYWGESGIEGTTGKIRSRSGGEDLKANEIAMDPYRYDLGQRRWQDTPRRTPIDSGRPTARYSPSNWRFLRPFDQLNRPYEEFVTGSARHLTGMHFSMADHRRLYEILGMAPQKSHRSTYRVEPPPWDQKMVDMPPEHANTGIYSFDIAPRKSWRLS